VFPQSTYEVIKCLQAKSIIASQICNRRQCFFVSNPQKLEQIIHEQHRIVNRITPFLVEKFQKTRKRSYHENFGFIIESKEFSQTVKDWFRFLWNFAKEKPDE